MSRIIEPRSSKKKRDSGVSVDSDRLKAYRNIRVKRKRLFRKRNELRIMNENIDVTPDILRSIPYLNVLKTDKKSQSQLDIFRSHVDIVFSGGSQTGLQTQIQSFNVSMLTGQTNSSSLIKNETVSHASLSWLNESEDYLGTDGIAVENIITVMPTRVNIILTETPVFYLFEMASVSAERNTLDGQKVQSDNDYYDYLTIGKGRNRKTVNAEVQTSVNVLKSRCTHIEHGKRKNSYAFASTWDMLDTFAGKSEISQSKTVVVTPLEESDPDYQNFLQHLNEQMVKLLKNPRFQNCVLVMERILANNNFNVQQKRFRGLIEQDPFRPDIAFKYDLDLLWTFKNEKTEGHPVTSMHWNPINKDILAVGYGKFYYNDNKNGFVYCWNIKNPSQPEREYYYNKPVTSVAFSTFTPNILAVGLYDGNVNILDITTKDVVVIAVTSPYFSPSRDPVWQVSWLPPDDYYPDQEYLVCVSEDGRICRLTISKTIEFVSTQLMRTLPIEGKIKGVYQPRHCPVTDVPLSKCSAAILISKHPGDKNKYFVGTDEGSIHRCSRHYLNQHLDMFLAHNGPVYSCEFSPFCHKLFLTCGADWYINIWAENYPKPLISLTKTMEAVEGACWSPANCTIIASIVGSEILIWDIQRRTYLPVAVHKSPTGCRNTIIQFTESGRNLLVADMEGNVHIFALVDMPFPPFYQTHMLLHVIKKALISNKDIVDHLDEII